MHDRSFTQTQFCAGLAPFFKLEELEQLPGTVFGLSPDYRIVYVNAAWNRFAAQNGGRDDEDKVLGAHYLNAIAAPLRPFYVHLLQSAAAATSAAASMHPVTHVYQCSSATLFREFRMQVYALPEQRGFVVVNALAVEVPHDSAMPPHAPESARYADERGVIVQCAHCRLFASVVEPGQWDWVPAWIENAPANISHGICPICIDYFYPEPSVE